MAKRLTSKTEPSIEELADMSPHTVRAKRKLVEQLLVHRSPEVRMTAATALGRARIGVPALRARLDSEPVDFVLAEICDALASSGSLDSTSDLESLAKEHPVEMARSYAAIALADLQKRSAVSFLRQRLPEERSRRGKATLATLLLALGAKDQVNNVVHALNSKDYLVRCRVANLIARYLRSLPAPLEVGLRRLAANDRSTAVRSSAAKALAEANARVRSY